MFQNLRTIVTTWPFIASVFMLIINDTWLKGAYPGTLSGKLSDFAGIAIVSFLLLAAQPQRSRLIYAVVFVGFAWWKSPLSQPAIDAANVLLPLPIGRTIDYSDLLATLVMPLCAAVTSNPAAFQISGRTIRKVLLVPVVALTTLGLMATSVAPVKYDYEIRRSASSGELDRQSIADTIAMVAGEHGLKCDECRHRTYSARYRGNEMELEYSFIGDRAISFRFFGFYRATFLFFGRGGEAKADRLRADLKRRLASLHGDLEYVEILDPP